MKTLTTLLFTLLFSISTFAVTFTVNDNGDTNDTNTADNLCLDANGNCTLRAAVEQAAALPSNDDITFTTQISLITLNNEVPILTNGGTLTINGRAANLLTIDGGAGANRVFNVNPSGAPVNTGVAITIRGMTITGGLPPDNGNPPVDGGGGILSRNSTLTLDFVHITGNSANSGGGLLSRGGFIMLNNSTISGNTVTGNGGGLDGASNLRIYNSTISGNTAGANGGGMRIEFVSLALRNATITDNSAASGGGIYNDGSGQGINTGNTIIAGNRATSFSEIFDRSFGAFTSAGNNIIGDSPGDSANTNQMLTYQSSDILDTPPMLGRLQDNGGTTPTHGLLNGSPAIDAGSNSLAADATTGISFTFDQRGLSRVRDGNADGAATVDIGALENQVGPTAASVTITGRIHDARGRGVSRATVVLIDERGVERTALTNPFGYYRFDDTTVGTYVLTVRHKRLTFTPRIFFADGMEGVDFYGIQQPETFSQPTNLKSKSG